MMCCERLAPVPRSLTCKLVHLVKLCAIFRMDHLTHQRAFSKREMSTAVETRCIFEYLPAKSRVLDARDAEPRNTRACANCSMCDCRAGSDGFAGRPPPPAAAGGSPRSAATAAAQRDASPASGITPAGAAALRRAAAASASAAPAAGPAPPAAPGVRSVAGDGGGDDGDGARLIDGSSALTHDIMLDLGDGDTDSPPNTEDQV